MQNTKNQFGLFRERRFLPYFITQFLGAFNDNVFKNALIILVTFHLSAGADAGLLVNIAAGLFILPFFLFSAIAGQLADKFDKSILMRRIKFLEIVIMCAGAIGFFLHNVPLLFGTLFLMGAQSAFFGPAKYGILPQHLAERELVGANGLVESGTFLAILLGTILGGVLADSGDAGLWMVSIAVILVAAAGWIASRGIPAAPPTDPGLTVRANFFAETIQILRVTAADRTVFHAVLGISWFWLYGALLLTQLSTYTKEVLAGDGTVATLLLTMFSIGIGAGSLFCERLAHRRIEMGLVPLGSIGMTVFGCDLAFAHAASDGATVVGAAAFIADAANWRLLFDLAMISMSGGIYIVPLYALVQNRSEPRYRSRIIAGNNILNAFFMVIASALAIGLLHAGLSIPQLFLVVALMNAAVAIYIYTLVPEFLARLLAWLLVNTIYRLREQDLHNIPETGPAVIVSNHVSYVDAVILYAVVPRPVRFVMDHRIFNIPVLNFIFRTTRAIPIASALDDRELLRKAYDEISDALNQGELVCIFPEGHITRTGEIDRFRNGIQRIVRHDPVPVVPVALRGLWGSLFSRKDGPAFFKLPRKLWARITISAGPPVAPQDVTAPLLHERVVALRGSER